MNIPAIRAQIGMWVYYVSALTFEQVKHYVKKVDDELHKSELLRDMLQRSITENYKNISEYIRNQDERFFNALILAVYDGSPQWKEIRLEYDDGEEFFDLGILKLSGEEKIFPVDGQHRVEGIKHAIEFSPELRFEKIPVIFIGHKKDNDGMQRARRMFSTLNRYAKPVSMRDIIALDEDDIIAITSRELIDAHSLFQDKRIFDAKTKALPTSNNEAFTSIITFYECNREILRVMLDKIDVKGPDNRKLTGSKKLDQFIKKRPKEELIRDYRSDCEEYWNALMCLIPGMLIYANSKIPDSKPFRHDNGGNILFRPAALLPFTKALVKIKLKHQKSFFQLVEEFPKDILELQHTIWSYILWDNINKSMIMNNQKTVELILLYAFDRNMLNSSDKQKMIENIKRLRQIYDDHDVEDLLNTAFLREDSRD